MAAEYLSIRQPSEGPGKNGFGLSEYYLVPWLKRFGQNVNLMIVGLKNFVN